MNYLVSVWDRYEADITGVKSIFFFFKKKTKNVDDDMIKAPSSDERHLESKDKL